MERAVTRITLDVQKIDSGVLINARRGDSARRLVVSLTSRGSPYAPGEGVTAVFYVRKADGNPCFNEAGIDGSTVSYDFTGQTTNVEGLAACEIRLYDAAGQLLTSPRFEMLVDDTEYRDGDVPDSSPEFTALTKLVTDGNALIRDLTDIQAGLEPIRAEVSANALLAQQAAEMSERSKAAALEAAQDAHGREAQAADHAAAAAEAARRAEEAAANGGGGPAYVVSDTPPEDTDVIWIAPVEGEYILSEAERQEIARLAAGMVQVPSDDHINRLINTALGVIENGAY